MFAISEVIMEGIYTPAVAKSLNAIADAQDACKHPLVKPFFHNGVRQLTHHRVGPDNHWQAFPAYRCEQCLRLFDEHANPEICSRAIEQTGNG